jgi:hypothetical protein
MKNSSKGLVTNAIKSNEQAGPKAVTTPVQNVLKRKGKAAPKTAIKPKQKSMPMASGRKLGNHF